MKVKIISSVILFLSSFINGQITRFQTNEFFKGDSMLLETKNVLDTDTTIKQGAYKLMQKFLKSTYFSRIHHNVISEDSLFQYVLLASGMYQNGQKESLWVEHFGSDFYRTGFYYQGYRIGFWKEYYNNELCGQGHYSSNHKIGKWIYYNICQIRDDTFVIYDYDIHKSIWAKTKAQPWEFKSLQKNLFLNSIALFPYGGKQALYQIIHSNHEASNIPSTVNGGFKVMLQIKVDSLGNALYTIPLVKYDSTGFVAKEYQRIIQLLPLEWIPATDLNQLPIEVVGVFPYSLWIH